MTKETKEYCRGFREGQEDAAKVLREDAYLALVHQVAREKVKTYKEYLKKIEELDKKISW